MRKKIFDKSWGSLNNYSGEKIKRVFKPFLSEIKQEEKIVSPVLDTPTRDL